jgi:hypothetical protein
MGDLGATEIYDLINFLIVPNDYIITAQFFSTLSTSCHYLSGMGGEFSMHSRNNK